jgi:hypothetical protein
VERLRDYLRLVIFGRGGAEPRLAGRYRWIAAFGFAVGFEVPVLLVVLEAGADAAILAGFALVAVPGGVAVGRWLVPAGGRGGG